MLKSKKHARNLSRINYITQIENPKSPPSDSLVTPM